MGMILLILFSPGMKISAQSPGDANQGDSDTRDVVDSPEFTFRAMSYNIRYNNPKDGVNAWPKRKERVGALIQFYKPDIIGVQEALFQQMRDLETLLPGYGWVGVGRDDGATKGEYSAIFYRRNKFRVLEKGTFWLSRQPDKPGSRGWDAACNRIVTWAKFQPADGSEAFYHFNTHFDHKGEKARLNSAYLLKKKIGALTGGASARVVVTGDFNARPDSDPMLVLADQDQGPLLFSARDKSETPPYGPRETAFGFSAAAEQGSEIDHILVSKRIQIDRMAVLTDSEKGYFPSDHLPLIADIRFK